MDLVPMEKREQWNRLYDLYGRLLTEKQREIFELYYHEDYSLGEISQLTGISRQGVHEHLRRAEAGLLALERELSLLQLQTERRQLLHEAFRHFQQEDWKALHDVLCRLWDMEHA